MIGPFLGPEGFERGWREWLAAFASYRVEQEPEPRRSGDAVVFFARQIATPRGSDQPVTSDGALVAFFHAGKARRIEFHLDREAALRSAGLPPSATTESGPSRISRASASSGSA
jgi:hypothetical protein